MSFFEELKRRNVVRVGTAYVVAAWVVIEVSSLILEIYEYPDSVMKLLVALLALGLPFVLFFAWAFEVTPEGVKRDSEVERKPGGDIVRARRLNIITISLLVIAVGLLVIDYVADKEGIEQAAQEETVEGTLDNEQIAQRMLEINRLRMAGDYPAAFKLAAELFDQIPAAGLDDDFWLEISMTGDAVTEPPGATVYRQTIDADEDDWEVLGTTPLTGIRFARGEGYRVRFELEGYEPAEFLQTAITGFEAIGIDSINPVVLDTADSLPDGMVRLYGFTHDLVDYDDFFMDRYEVTNREFQKFVAAGGYENPDYWPEGSFDKVAELCVDRTGRPGPSTWSGGAYPSGQGDYPVGGVSWYEAMAYANFVGKQLPTAIHYDQAREFDYIDNWLESSRSNLEGSGPRPVGENRAMATTGLFDVAGNVREWCLNDSGEGQKCTTGAAWTDAPYHTGWIIPKAPWDRHETNGFRLVKAFDDPAKLERLAERTDPEFRRDYWSETPASDAEYAIYKRMYAYDPQPLNAEVLWEEDHGEWIKQRVAFDLPYGERGSAILYVPTSLEGPAKPVLQWPGSGYLEVQDEHVEYWNATFDFLMRNGYAVVFPFFKGSYDRDDEDYSITFSSVMENSKGSAYRDIFIKWVQDLSRTIDYLETRPDIDTNNIAYAGHSWGGQAAPVALAVEERIKTAVLNVGGLWEYYEYLPEVDPINFVTRVETPVLMLNGEFDIVFPLETGQRPMFEFLGTPPEHKQHIVTSDAHLVSREVLIKETLDWLDKYLD